jgi:Putative DNA-binding domain
VNGLAAQQRALKQAIVQRTPIDGVSGRVGIYREAYIARLVAALRDNYGVLPQVLGDDAFDVLGAAYLAAHPSQQPSIRWFGDRLPAFIAQRADLVPHPAIADLAQMEWALRGAFDAADAVPIGAAALAGVSPDAWPGLVFDALPSVRLLPMAWAVEPLWRALQDQGDDPELPEPREQAHTLLVWRPALQTRWRVLEPLAARLLQAALAGRPFAALCALAASEVGPTAAAATTATALRSWLDDGLFSAWRARPEGTAD